MRGRAEGRGMDLNLPREQRVQERLARLPLSGLASFVFCCNYSRRGVKSDQTSDQASFELRADGPGGQMCWKAAELHGCSPKSEEQPQSESSQREAKRVSI